MEIPVVATSISCEGIKAAPGKDILVADTPEEFTQKVIDLLTNRNLRHKLTTNGRQKVEEEYSWDSRAIMVQEIFNRLLSR
jgi:glycosyltransferase involved in cell wall biosynthesis